MGNLNCRGSGAMFDVIVMKNGEVIAGIGFEEEDTAYNVLREAGFTASETRELLKDEWK